MAFAIAGHRALAPAALAAAILSGPVPSFAEPVAAPQPKLNRLPIY